MWKYKEITIALFLCASCVPLYAALWPEYFETSDCAEPPLVVYPDFNLTWLVNVPKWYHVMMSKGELFRVSERLLGIGKAENMTESDLIENACLYTLKGTEDALDPKIGFGNKSTTFKLHLLPRRPWTSLSTTLENEYLFTSYTIDTDSSSFLTVVNMWSDGLRGFAVYSQTPSMSEDIEKRTRSKLISLGFKDSLMLRMNYDQCQVSD